MTIEDLANLDLAQAPPYSPTMDDLSTPSPEVVRPHLIPYALSPGDQSSRPGDIFHARIPSFP